MPVMNVSELTGAALDWAVATVDGRTIRLDPMGFGNCSEGGYWVWEEVPSGKGGTLIDKAVYLKIGRNYSPSTKWQQGGPLIDKIEGLEVKRWMESAPESKCQVEIHNCEGDWVSFGPTVLIAAMRALVASKVGQTINIPKELTC